MWEQSFLKCHWVSFVVLEVYLNMIKMIRRKPTFNISLNWRKPKSFFCWLNQHRVKIWVPSWLLLILFVYNTLWKHTILSNYDYKKILLKQKQIKKSLKTAHSVSVVINPCFRTPLVVEWPFYREHTSDILDITFLHLTHNSRKNRIMK